jgi:uncharacterized membrane protein
VIPNAAPSYEVTQDDRTMGSLAHFLQIVCSWIAPLAILLLKRDSLFVKFHALQALLLQICMLAVCIVGVGAFMATMLLSVPASGSSTQNAPPLAMMVGFGVLWLVMMGGWALVLIVAVIYGIKAGRGEWAGYPVIGRLARQLLKI